MTRRATLRDIAKAAGVSTVTVHKAIYSKSGVGTETRKKILDIAKSMNYSVNEAASSLKRKALHIAVILQSAGSPQNFFFRKMWDGIEKAEAQLNDYRVRFTRIECGDDWKSQEEILCGIARAQQVNGVILHCWDDTELNPAIDYLYEKGIPVVTANSDAIGSKRVGCVSAPNERIGRLAAEIFGYFLPDGGKVILAGGNRMVENLRDTRKGFISYIRSSRPRMTATELYSSGDWERFRVELAEILESGEGVAGIYAVTSRDTYNACCVVRDLGLSGRIKVLGSDVFSEQIPFFEDGTLHATVWKDQEAQAERAVMLLYQYLSERPLSVEPIKIGIVMKNNIEDYL